MLQTVQNDTTNDQLAIIKGELANQFNISIDEYTWSGGDMEVPISSAAVSRAKLFAANPKLPMTLQDQANFWVCGTQIMKILQLKFWNCVTEIAKCSKNQNFLQENALIMTRLLKNS